MAKEIVFSGKGKVILQDAELAPLGQNEIRGKTLVTLISPGTELAWLAGDNFPLRPGYAAIFEAEDIGLDVKDVARGDLLLCMGPHRSIQQMDRRYVEKIPPGLQPEKAVIARLAGVSVTTLMTTAARPHDKVLICGAGPVGYLAAHLFYQSGYQVTVIEPNLMRRDLICKSGIERVFDSIPVGDADYDGQVALVVDCSGHEKAILDGCKVVRKKGEVVLVGVPWKAHTNILAHELMNAVFFKFVVLRSGWEWEVPVASRSFVWEELYEGYNNAPHSTMSGLKLALDWIANKRVPLDGIISKHPIAQPQELYDHLSEGKIQSPFVVLNWAE